MKLGRAHYLRHSWKRRFQISFWIAAILVGFSGASANNAIASEASKAPATDQKSVKSPLKVVIAPRSDYCANIAHPAAEARFAFQKKTLEDLQIVIEQKLIVIEEHRQFILAFEEKQRKQEVVAQKMVVDIFAKMKPDIAARQLEKVDFQTSVSILTQLNVRVASTILNEMQTDTAAAIASAMADVNVPTVSN